VTRFHACPLPLLRAVILTGVLALGALAPVASCSSTLPDRGASPADATVDVPGATVSCSLHPDPGRCSGGDPRFVFFPSLACDPSVESEGGVVEAGSAVDANVDGSDASVDPCAGVTTLDLFFTAPACQAFALAEGRGQVAKNTDPSAPVIDEPSDGAMLTPDNWSIFVWHRSARDARRDPLERVLGLLEPSAQAASPLRGDGYVLEFTQACTEVLRVMLAETTWVPDPASWAILTSLTGPVQVRVYWMGFTADALASTPVPSVPVTITMQGDGGG
jgi:hypothetical protein